MENKRLLNFTIIMLLLLNLGTLSFLWFGHRPPPGPPPPGGRENAAEFLTRELALSTEQQKQYESLREEHHHRVMGIQDSIHTLREKFFNELPAPGNSRADSLAEQIGRGQSTLEKITFDHFRKVRALCTPDQQKKFDSVIQEALRMMAPPPGPPPPGR